MRQALVFLLVTLPLTPTTSRAQLTAKRIVRFVIPEVRLAVSIAVDGDTVLLGTDGPEALVFQFDGASWWMDRLTVPSTTEWDWFDTVTLHEDLALIGVSFSSNAYLFRFDGTKWVHEATLADDQARDSFGESVAVQGDLAVVAVPPSEAQVFRFDGRHWTREARLLPPSNIRPHGST